jgi:hypothetical protein
MIEPRGEPEAEICDTTLVLHHQHELVGQRRIDILQRQTTWRKTRVPSSER